MPKVFNIVLSKPFLEKEYEENQKSIRVIASENNISPSCVRRHLIYFGIYIRTQSQAQALAESSGRRKNPTKGRKRRPEELSKISRGVVDCYKNKTEEEKKLISERLRKQYENMTDEQKAKLRERSKESLREVSRNGSHLEKYIVNKLRESGYIVEFHKQFIIKNEQMHLDIFLPQLNLVIEVDGPTHLRPVYSVEEFRAKRERDNRKNALLIEEGLKIIRLGAERSDSISLCEIYYEKLAETLKEISSLKNNILYIGDYENNS